MATRKRLVIANWKMYVESLDEAKTFAQGLKRKIGKLEGVEVGVAAPAPFIAPLGGALARSKVMLGAQSVSSVGSVDSAQGKAHTGEVSAAMLKSAGAQFVIVGHSERRAAGDTDEAVQEQFAATAGAGLVPVLCIGERERQSDGSHVGFVAEQLHTALMGSQSLARKLVVAYEPIWAIGGTAQSAMQPHDVREMAIFIKKTLADILDRAAALKVPILYGGSVEPGNAAALIAEGDINGFLVGHASANLTSFIEILQACKK